MKFSAVILAAGEGRRMGAGGPKVLCDLGGAPLLGHVIGMMRRLGAGEVHIVVGHGGDRVREAFGGDGGLVWHEQREQLGTAHAVSCALPALGDDDTALITYGDMPLIHAGTYRGVLDGLAHADLALLTADVAAPAGYGRILRDARGGIAGIVEEADATPEQRAITEVNLGVMAAKARVLRALIAEVGNDNNQREYYLTDCAGAAVAGNLRLASSGLRDASEAAGVNDRIQLEHAERILQRRRVHSLMARGACVRDASRLEVRAEVEIGQNVLFDVGVVLEGGVELGDDVSVGAYSMLRDVSIGAGTVIKPYSIVEDAQIGARCRVGPYARIRPQTVLADEVHVGNFVEVKKSVIGAGSKANHLSYIGDSEIGAAVNVGAGVITCNYDGADKHRTVIGDDVFIGSDTQLVAPVAVGDGATIGAGSTITRDADAGALTLSRSEQKTVAGWRRPRKKGAG